ncbi:MAG: hypothetical protein Q8N99_03265 [Nanoarchaeota archaeon]|nr:hypothetical protein [Nanoarchaeota archaeon]
MADEQTQYGVIKATPVLSERPVLPVRDLLPVPHRNIRLVVGHPAFGPSTYLNNLAEMQKTYFHSQQQPKISFREPTTSESISVCAYEFKKKVKPEILDPRWLQIGRIVRTLEGVFANPPKDAQENFITDKKILMHLLNGVEETNGIYLVENNPSLRDFGYAPYESFASGVQNCNAFIRGGLARLLEHTKEEVAKNLSKIASPKFYPRGVSVLGFDAVNKPVLRVACLDSYWYSGSDGMDILGYDWVDDDCGGCAFGVLNSSEVDL